MRFVIIVNYIKFKLYFIYFLKFSQMSNLFANYFPLNRSNRKTISHCTKKGTNPKIHPLTGISV